MKNTLLVLFAYWILGNPNGLLAQQSSQPLIHGAMKECHDGRVTQDRISRVGHFEKGQAWGNKPWLWTIDLLKHTSLYSVIWGNYCGLMEN